MQDSTSSSRISSFYKLEHQQRLEKIAEFLGESNFNQEHFLNTGNTEFQTVDNMIENAIGTMNIPIGVATNMIIDGKDRLIPMATEESSVVAAVCNAARQCRATGGFYTHTSEHIMIGQIQLVDVINPMITKQVILENEHDIKAICNDVDPLLVKLGGGFKGLEVRVLDDGHEYNIIVHILVDTCDAMGANAVNSMVEALSPALESWTSAKANMRILSNLADKRLSMARATWPTDEIGGEAVRDAMLSAFRFADTDPYRAATHNKGIMNGISAVILATGNDTRAIEAGAHAYACKTGQYRSLSSWGVDKDGNLCGSLELPMAVGLIGGATKVHPTAQQNLEILNIDSADELARITCAVGLAQNFAAMKALVTTGIQKGHMSLHAKNIALMAGAKTHEVDTVTELLVQSGKVRIDVAEEILTTLRQNNT
ncbi:hydroxymethylglutaryl-CoA reductase, degradative [Psychrobacter sp. JB385]|uniref:hydroxymethylglutaryl-CoA reductase, degradative n=1 Tax=Psychrobacter sp. JB385 TaxID=1434841 RepID=UPI00097F5B20|nr:hydroxymethylglutaryl-CoA reductase, degradative [Psychrobacter sp. JB385]SJN36028.1 Hydroxymethylglutaryl-CoA reductase [Psychrobacter sp. JB385]